jgi:hypothetical protein
LFERYGSPGWIAAYNAGPGRYEDSLDGRPLPAETRAYLAIVAQSERSAATDPLPVERASSDASATPAVRDVSAIVPQSGGLFVARADDRTAR